MAAVAAGLRTGVLDHLRRAPGSAAGIASARGWSDETVLDRFLHVLGGKP